MISLNKLPNKLIGLCVENTQMIQGDLYCINCVTRKNTKIVTCFVDNICIKGSKNQVKKIFAELQSRDIIAKTEKMRRVI